MSKYWKLITFWIATVLILCVFYIESANYSKQLPQFFVKKMQGDEEVTKSLTVSAQHYYGMNGSESFQVDQSGTNYLRDEPYFKRLEGFSHGPKIEDWRRDYRSFMRGKDIYGGHFNETADKLSYVSVITSSPLSWEFDTFDLHVIDKATKKENHFTIEIPAYAKYWQMEILYTYIKDNEYTVITEAYYDESMEDKVDINRYTFDIEAEKLIDEERIYDSTMSLGDNLHEEILLHTSDQNKEHIIIEKRSNHFKDVESDSGEVVDTDHSIETKELIKYNAQTKSKEEVMVPNELTDSTLLAFDQTKYYFTKEASSKIEIIPYQFKEKKVMDGWEVDMQQPEDASWGTYTTLKKNKLYYLYDVDDEVSFPDIYVIDLQKEKLVFTGEITTEEPVSNTDNYHFEELFIY